MLLDDLESYLADQVAFATKPDRPPFRRFIEYKSSSNAEEANAFWERYFTQFPNTKKLYTVPDSYTPCANRIIFREAPFNRPARSVITLSNIAHVAFALSLCQIIGSHETILYSARASRAISMPGADSIMGPMLSLIPLHIQLPSKEPVLTVLQSLQDLSTRMLKYELFSEDYFRRRGAAPDEIRFNWLPLGSDLSSRVVRFTTDDDKASLRIVQEQTPNPPNS